MLTTNDYTFGKEEHLCRQTLIDQLFGGNAHTMMAWPLKIVYLLVDTDAQPKMPVQLLVSVSKRSFKRAVKRNRVKRQIRESYRFNKLYLQEKVSAMTGKQLLIAIIWQDGKLHDSVEIETKMQKVLNRLADKL